MKYYEYKASTPPLSNNNTISNIFVYHFFFLSRAIPLYRSVFVLSLFDLYFILFVSDRFFSFVFLLLFCVVCNSWILWSTLILYQGFFFCCWIRMRRILFCVWCVRCVASHIILEWNGLAWCTVYHVVMSTRWMPDNCCCCCCFKFRGCRVNGIIFSLSLHLTSTANNKWTSKTVYPSLFDRFKINALVLYFSF